MSGPGILTHGASPQPHNVGMPALLYLHDFGRVIREGFGTNPVLVGSALLDKRSQARPNDIDVRLVLTDIEFLHNVGELMDFGRPFTRWASLCKAYSALGKVMTGLNIDFQIQPLFIADRYNAEACIELGKGLR